MVVMKKNQWISLFLIVILSIVCGVFVFVARPQASTVSATSNKTHPLWKERSAGAPLITAGTRPLASLSGLVKELKPAVVNIYTTQVIAPAPRSFPGRRGRMNDPLWDFFFGGEDPFGFFGSPGREFKRSSLGSGFIISPDGYALTNHHVIAQASEIKVKLVDEREYRAKVVGSDPRTDVALIRLEIKNGEQLPTVYLGDSDRIEVGDWVVAIGNPFGLGHTVTAGIISAKDRQIGHGPYDDFLQTDAAINPGNSGGPLFDTAGNVVGINTAIVAHGSGIGFAVPINLVKKLLPQLRDKGKVSRGWLGVGIQELSPDLAAGFGVAPRSGVLVGQVFAKSPAAKAGMKPGDIITHIESQPMLNTRQLISTVAGFSPGRTVAIKILRDGKPMTLKVKLADRDESESADRETQDEDETVKDPKGSSEDTGISGLALEVLSDTQARQMKLDSSVRGLLVKSVAHDSPAAGLVQQGDVILEVNRKAVSSIAEFRATVKSASRVLLRIARKNAQVYVAFDNR